MSYLTLQDRYHILALNPAFVADLKRLHALRKTSTTRLKQLFVKNPKARMKARSEGNEIKAIEARMNAVGIVHPPAPSQFFALLKSLGNHSVEGFAVKPRMRRIQQSVAKLKLQREGKPTSDRISIGKLQYDLNSNQILTIDIDIGAHTPKELCDQIQVHIMKARKQAGFTRKRSRMYDDWSIWTEKKRGRTLTEMAREQSNSPESARNNPAVHAAVVRMQKALRRVDKKIRLLPYPT